MTWFRLLVSAQALSQLANGIFLIRIFHQHDKVDDRPLCRPTVPVEPIGARVDNETGMLFQPQVGCTVAFQVKPTRGDIVLDADLLLNPLYQIHLTLHKKINIAYSHSAGDLC